MVTLKGVAEPLSLMVLEWRDKSRFAARVKIVEEPGEEHVLPALDTITFGRLRDQAGVPANDIVLQLREKEKGLRVSRWHFELRRQPDGFLIRSVTNQATEVDGTALAKGQEMLHKPTARVLLAGGDDAAVRARDRAGAIGDAATTGYIR